MREDFWTQVDTYSAKGLALALIDGHSKTDLDRELPTIEFDKPIAFGGSTVDTWQEHNAKSENKSPHPEHYEDTSLCV
jgi:hypothetical protein